MHLGRLRLYDELLTVMSATYIIGTESSTASSKQSLVFQITTSRSTSFAFLFENLLKNGEFFCCSYFGPVRRYVPLSFCFYWWTLSHFLLLHYASALHCYKPVHSDGLCRPFWPQPSALATTRTSLDYLAGSTNSTNISNRASHSYFVLMLSDGIWH